MVYCEGPLRCLCKGGMRETCLWGYSNVVASSFLPSLPPSLPGYLHPNAVDIIVRREPLVQGPTYAAHVIHAPQVEGAGEDAGGGGPALEEREGGREGGRG